MYCSMFDRKSNNTLNNIVELTSTITSLDSKKVTKLLTGQKQHANAIYEVLKLLKEKGQQNRSQDWIDETLYYCVTADVYTLLSLDNTITTLKNAPLLDSSILPALREKGYFSQQRVLFRNPQKCSAQK